MDLKLKHKTAFISGSARGIGFAIARQLMSEGVQVIVNGRTSEKTAEAVRRLRAIEPLGNVTGITADFSKAEEVTGLIGKLRDELGLTIILIEHDMSVVGGISDRVIALDHGEKIAEGPFDAVATDPLVVEAYLGHNRKADRK